MFLSLHYIMFSLALLMGTLLTISSSSWFSAWVGLELNLLSFIPLIISSYTRYSSEAALKYFLVQALASSLIIFSSSILMFYSYIFSTVLACALLMKLGAAPFHFWFPQVMEGMLWPQAAILMTIQKVGPIFLLSYLMDFYSVFYILLMCSILSALTGAVGGINQLSLRKIMAFSSINHMAWMLAANLISEFMVLFYLVFYCLLSLTVIMIFYFQQSFHFNHLFNQNTTFTPMKVMTFLSLLSLGGLPPFTGFIPKWIMIQELVNMKLFLLLSFLLMSALVTLYYYIRVLMSFLNLSSIKLMFGIMQNYYYFTSAPLLISMNLMFLIFPVCFMFF